MNCHSFSEYLLFEILFVYLLLSSDCEVQFIVKHLGDLSESCRCFYSPGWLGFCPCVRRRRRPGTESLSWCFRSSLLQTHPWVTRRRGEKGRASDGRMKGEVSKCNYRIIMKCCRCTVFSSGQSLKSK